jgi:hypothetical protein
MDSSNRLEGSTNYGVWEIKIKMILMKDNFGVSSIYESMLKYAMKDT